MRIIWYITFLLLISSCSDPELSRTDFIFDQEEILSEEQEATLGQIFLDHELKTSNEIVLVTTSSYEPDNSIFWYAINFGGKLGVGKKDINNGVVIAFSKTNGEIWVSLGYGIEKVMKDQEVKAIIDSLMTPEFNRKKYFEGLVAGSKAIIDHLEQPENEIK